MSLHDHEPLVTVKSVHDDGDLALYTNGDNGHPIHLDLGDEIVTTSDTDLVPLAKAILNAVEPEALVENQKDAEPGPYEFKVGDRVRLADDPYFIAEARGAAGTVARVSAREIQVAVDGKRWHQYDEPHGPRLTLIAPEPEPYKPQVGDWVKVADVPTYNRYFRDQTLQVVDPGYRVSDFEVVVRGTDGFTGSLRTKDVTPASAPTPERDLAAEVDTLTERVAALEAAADTEIRVGDTVRVEPDDWNIPTPSATRGRAVTGEVVKIVRIIGKKRYLVQFRSLNTDTLNSLYAVKATKVVSRG